MTVLTRRRALWASPLIRRFVLLIGAISLTLAIGTTGFCLLEGFPPFDAFYMSLITITTVGYKEIYDLSSTGRLFNSFLIFIGVTQMYLAIGLMTQTIVEMELGGAFWKKRIQRMINQLSDHYVICGYGRVGRGACEELQRSGVPLVVLERDPQKVQQLMGEKIPVLAVDATQDRSLLEANIGRAKGLIAALATDADNLFVVLSARELNPGLRIAVRIGDEGAEAKLRRAGADTIISPYARAGKRMAQTMIRPNVTQFIENLTQDLGLDVVLEEIQVSPTNLLVNKSLGDLHLRRDMGVIVLAIRRSDGRMIFNPAADERLAGSDCLVAMGRPQDMQRLSGKLNRNG